MFAFHPPRQGRAHPFPDALQPVFLIGTALQPSMPHALGKAVQPPFARRPDPYEGGRQAGGHLHHASALAFHPHLHTGHHAAAQVVQPRSRLQLMVDQESRSRRGSLHPRMRHGINHRVVALVPDAGDDRQRELCAGRRQQVRVETRKVAGGAPAPDNDHHIPTVVFRHDGIQSRKDGLLHPLALHDGGKQTGRETESVFISQQLVAEIAVARRRGGRNDRNPVGQQRHGERLVVVQDAVGLQLRQYLPPQPCQVAQSIGGVNVPHRQRIAVKFMERHRDLHQHLQPRRQRSSRLALEHRFEQAVRPRPDHATRLGHQIPPALVLLHELHITVPVVSLAHLAQFGLQPIFIGERTFHHAPHKVVQFI